MATTPAKKSVSKKASVSEDAARANRERPSEPKPYKATKEELLKFYRDMLLIRRFEEKAGQLFIFDELRKKELVLTPEEWVRQHFIQHLIHQKKYPR